MRKKHFITGGIIIPVLLLLWVGWKTLLAPTRIAFVNYSVIELGQIAKANNNPRIKIEEVSPNEPDKLKGYDMVFVNAMGLRITAEEREVMLKMAEKGLPILSTMVTNPANDINSVDSLSLRTLKGYLSNGGRTNYRSMLNYVRKNIDHKALAVGEIEPIVERKDGLLYHYDPKDREGDELVFSSLASYISEMTGAGLWKEGQPVILVTGPMGVPEDLMQALEEKGHNVVGVSDMWAFVTEHHTDSLTPSAVINMAHGRMGDYIVRYLHDANVPLFAPLNVNTTVEEWERDNLGMSGGFLSQSVVTPEIDGAIRPFALFGHYIDKEDLHRASAIRDRLTEYIETIDNYIKLRTKPNREKKIAIYYYKGPGQNALTASGMEVVPSLYNLLTRLRKEGYNVDGLPSSAKELGEMLQERGKIFGGYAEGAAGDFLKSGDPQLITKEEYEAWVKADLREEKYREVVERYGDFPGKYLATPDGKLAIARLRFGNVVLMPQYPAGMGENDFKMVHGTDMAPPHAYIASYLWTRHGFGADALLHMGTHGSLEFTPHKQVALSSLDWPDRLVGPLPHFYIYTIGNVGEGMIAKRRSYAGLISYLTPPFMESKLRDTYKELMDAIKRYNRLLGDEGTESALSEAALAVKRLTVKMGIHRELGLDSIPTTPYTGEEIERVEGFAEEIATEKITGTYYTMGVPYESARIESSVFAMATDPIAYSLFTLDKLRGKADPRVEKHASLFTERYLDPAKKLVTRLLLNPSEGTESLVSSLTGSTAEEIAQAHKVVSDTEGAKDMLATMMQAAREMRAKKTGMPNTPSPENHKTDAASGATQKAHEKKVDAASGATQKAHGQKGQPSKEETSPMSAAMKMSSPKYTAQEIEKARAIVAVDRAVRNVGNYRSELLRSPESEILAIFDALSGGYTEPSPGGDPIVNPNTLPTGRNLYGVNAEATPSENAWEEGKKLADRTIKMYRKRHNDSIPRKVSYTLWSGEFIETEGATIAQVLYMLGVEPVRDAFGRVTDLRLIPSHELGRPRIDVVVQTSGQLRDLAASRLFLIQHAVEMAASAKDDSFPNQVADGIVESERMLIDKGITPKKARAIASYRVFGGVNGNYGTGIQGMVMSSDRWEKEEEIADVYLNNMGAFYGSEKEWEAVHEMAFRAALTRTDAVIQPRQSNTWGALSLDHVYEFMGGLNLAVRNVTGKDPDAYLSDYRNHHNMRMQEVKEAIGAESRTTILNPTYIREKMKGDAGSAASFAEVVQNTFGWEVMKPNAIDNELWDRIYDVYVTDSYNLGIREYFETKDAAALEEISAVMMESARKGMWHATDEQMANLAKLHTELVDKHGVSCSGFVCDNPKLRAFISEKATPEMAKSYLSKIEKARVSTTVSHEKGTVLKKEEISRKPSTVSEDRNEIKGATVVATVVILLILIALLIRRRLKTH